MCSQFTFKTVCLSVHAGSWRLSGKGYRLSNQRQRRPDGRTWPTHSDVSVMHGQCDARPFKSIKVRSFQLQNITILWLVQNSTGGNTDRKKSTLGSNIEEIATAWTHLQNVGFCNCNSNVCTAPPTISLEAHHIIRADLRRVLNVFNNNNN